MTIQQSVGTALAFSADVPATFDEAGFTALTFTPVGKLQGIPDLDGKYDIVTGDDLTSGEEYKQAGMFRSGDGEFDVILDDDDAGQNAIYDARGQRGAFKITLKNGTVFYRTAIILSMMPTGLAPDSFVMAKIAVAFDRSTVRVLSS